ncbi:SGNH/GDSL hydrolase family protein [Muricauda sp. 2012CJ35-5]|uniref:SGNH/GDSL hydrolase family protein n=1 Tax=Flagellimonas spongiicola TaxID=2942208 RepID=A0ABT0PQF3_9FLAO|nr:SGNH/GDSL hydrolase family protein [Allomuricauda spongiicola]MCL6273627.1 SGNH/GDSL hydrolase family protein [Allomuricauda spongiicola]
MKIIVFHSIICLFFLLLGSSCTKNQAETTIQTNANENVALNKNKIESNEDDTAQKMLYYAALGDSYTLGTGISEEESFPNQLQTSLAVQLNTRINLEILAVNGWRTDNLLSNFQELDRDSYDLITLLIGVNNQFQGLDYEKFTMEFSELVEHSINLANNKPERVILISIPDYTYSSLGSVYASDEDSSEIDKCNGFIATIAEQTGCQFADFTDISRKGLEKPEYIAPDGLHLSALAYEEFVSRIQPMAYSELAD